MSIFSNRLCARHRDGLRYIQTNCMDPKEFKLQVDDGHVGEENVTKSELLNVSDHLLMIQPSSSFHLLLHVVGIDDKIANSLRCWQYMVNRMKKYGKRNQVTLLTYRGAGYFIDPPFMPLQCHYNL